MLIITSKIPSKSVHTLDGFGVMDLRLHFLSVLLNDAKEALRSPYIITLTSMNSFAFTFLTRG